MSRQGWMGVARWAATVFLVAVIVAVGARLGWWQALADDPADAPWDWVERLTWIIAVLLFVLGLFARRVGGSAPPPEGSAPTRRPWHLIPVAECRPGQVGVHGAPDLPAYVLRDYDPELRAQLREAADSGGWWS